MAITAPGPSAPPEKPDAEAAKQGGGKGVDRPGFDLGGAKEGGRDGTGSGSAPASPVSAVDPGNPASPAIQTASSGGTTGMTEGGDRTVGGLAGGAKPGEADRGTAGAVRPPQTTSADHSFEQGNPDDAA